MNLRVVTETDAARDEAEISVIGSVFAEPSCAAEALRLVAEDNFAHREHRYILRAIAWCAENGVEPDPLAVRDVLRRQHHLDAAGGDVYLARIVDIVPTAANLAYWAGVVRELGARRRAAAALESGEDLAAVRDMLADSTPAPRIDLFDPYTGGRAREDARTAGRGISTGIASLDAAGFHLSAGNVWTYAGRQGGGKTALLLETTMRHVEREPDACALFISFEGSRYELYMRLLLRQVAVARVEEGREPGAPYLADSTRWLQTGQVFPHVTGDTLADEWESELARAAKVLDDHVRAHRLVLVDGDDVPNEDGSSAVTADRIMDALRLAPTRPTLAVFDYWQKLGPRNRTESRVAQLQETADRLRRFAKGDGDPAQVVVVLTAAQVNREAQGQPGLANIREADDLGNDGAGVVTLFMPDSVEPVKKLRLQVVKNRFGPNGGRAELLFYGSCGYFAETDTETERNARANRTRERIRAEVERIYAENPAASQREVCESVTGKTDTKREIYREVFGRGDPA